MFITGLHIQSHRSAQPLIAKNHPAPRTQSIQAHGTGQGEFLWEQGTEGHLQVEWKAKDCGVLIHGVMRQTHTQDQQDLELDCLG